MRDCLIVLLLVLLALSWAGGPHGAEAQIESTTAPVVASDYPVCVTIRNAPLPGPRPTATNPYPRRNDTA